MWIIAVWNQVKGRSSASLLAAVGDSRASMGEPMKVMEAGRASSASSAIRAAAASTGGTGLADGHDVGARAHRLQHLLDVVDVVVEIEPPLQDRHLAGVHPVGDVDLVVLQEGLDRAAQKRGVVT